MIRETSLFAVVVLCLPVEGRAQREHVARYTLHEDSRAHLHRATFNVQRVSVHYGKWLTAASAVALTWMGAHEHARSADAWDELVAFCRVNNANCTLGPNGRYLNGVSEDHYQRSLRYDRRARTRLLAGQGALLLTIGFFLLDRNHGDDGPENIPFPSLEMAADPRAAGAQVGFRWTF